MKYVSNKYVFNCIKSGEYVLITEFLV